MLRFNDYFLFIKSFNYHYYHYFFFFFFFFFFLQLILQPVRCVNQYVHQQQSTYAAMTAFQNTTDTPKCQTAYYIYEVPVGNLKQYYVPSSPNVPSYISTGILETYSSNHGLNTKCLSIPNCLALSEVLISYPKLTNMHDIPKEPKV